MADNARIVVEVQAGVIPGTPEPEYTRRWAITGQQWAEAKDKPDGLGELLSTFNGRAAGYAALLMLQPDRLNWVRTDWIYL